MKKKKRKKLTKKIGSSEKGNVQIVNIRVNSDGGNDADKSLKRLKAPIY